MFDKILVFVWLALNGLGLATSAHAMSEFEIECKIAKIGKEVRYVPRNFGGSAYRIVRFTGCSKPSSNFDDFVLVPERLWLKTYECKDQERVLKGLVRTGIVGPDGALYSLINAE